MQVAVSISGLITPYEFETLTVTTAVTNLTSSKYLRRGSEAARDLGNARMVMIEVVSGTVRYRIDGLANPDGSTGHRLREGERLTLSGHQQFTNFAAYRDATEASNATLAVTYFR